MNYFCYFGENAAWFLAIEINSIKWVEYAKETRFWLDGLTGLRMCLKVLFSIK
jgi:hypothetical protein